MSFPQNIAGLDFTAEALAAQRAINSLREQNVDLLNRLVHMGLPYDTRQAYEACAKQKNRI